MKRNIYDDKPRERLLKYGPSSLSLYELMIIILNSGNKKRSVYNLSSDILDKYSINDLKNISANDLINIDGIGISKACHIISSIELGRRLFLKNDIKLTRLSTAKDIYEYTKYLFNDLKQEKFYCLYFNVKQELIKTKILYIGTIDKCTIHPREVFKEAFLSSASSIICMHNHPTGDVNPSNADIMITKSLIRIGTICQIPVVDHIIVSNNYYYSFNEHKEILDI